MVEMGYLPIAINQETINKAKERFLKEMKKKQIEVKETEIYLFEDVIEEKAIQMEENRLIKRMIKNKEYLKEKVSLNWNNNSSNNSISRNPFSRNP
jgi:pseudouridine-5'-phosphate glycosidase